MPVNIWKVQPLQLTVVEILEKERSVTDTELFGALKALHRNIGFGNLNKTLMKMEVTRLISVSSSAKGKRVIQLIRR